MNYRSIQGCGESFFRVYNEAGRVVMTAKCPKDGPTDSDTGFSAVAVIWQDHNEVFGTKGFKDAINAVRAAALSPFLRSF